MSVVLLDSETVLWLCELAREHVPKLRELSEEALPEEPDPDARPASAIIVDESGLDRILTGWYEVLGEILDQLDSTWQDFIDSHPELEDDRRWWGPVSEVYDEDAVHRAFVRAVGESPKRIVDTAAVGRVFWPEVEKRIGEPVTEDQLRASHGQICLYHALKRLAMAGRIRRVPDSWRPALFTL